MSFMTYENGTFGLPCYVYALLCRDSGGPLYVKFGRTQMPHKRFRQISQGCPIPAKWFGLIEVDGEIKQARLERGLHQHFKPRRVRGEWFKFDADSDGDKADFNNGCAIQFITHLGKPGKWEKVSVKALDNWAKYRQAAFLSQSGKFGSPLGRKQAWRELEKYGK